MAEKQQGTLNTLSTPSEEGGYILLYVVLAVTIFAALASSVVSNTVTQVELGAQELAATRATMGADAALECISYYANLPTRPFYTNTPLPSYSITCGPGMYITPFKDTETSNCAESTKTYPLSLTTAAGTQCTEVIITTQPRQFMLQPGSNAGSQIPIAQYCALRVQANGYDGPCDSTEMVRSRWEQIGGYGDANEVILLDTATNRTRNTPYIDYGSEAYDVEASDAVVRRPRLTTSSSSVLQVERSGIENFQTMTSPVLVEFANCGYSCPPAGAVEVNVKSSPGLDTAMHGEALRVELSNVDTGDVIQTGFDASPGGGNVYPNKFNLKLGVPASIEVGSYLVRVTAWYLRASSTLLIPFEVASSSRGSF